MSVPVTEPRQAPGDVALVVALDDLGRGDLARAGGKAANLGVLLRAGLPVPPGFCVTTEAYSIAAAGAGMEGILDALAAAPAGDAERLEALAEAARERLREA